MAYAVSPGRRFSHFFHKVIILSILAMALAIAITVIAPMPAFCEESPGYGTLLSGQEATKAIERVLAGQGRIKSMKGRTTQEKRSPLLEGVVRTEGRIWTARPMFLRWEMDRPERLVIVADDQAMTVYRPKAKEAIRRLLSNDMSARYMMEFFSSGMTLSMDALSKRFVVSVYAREDSTVVELKPKSKVAGRFLRRVVIAYGPDGVPEWFEVENSNGATTLTRLSDVSINPEMPESLFRLDLPADVVVRRPLEEEAR